MLSLCLVEVTHRQHVQRVEVDAPEVAHVDGTLIMLNMSIIHSAKSVRGRWLIWKDLYSVGQVWHDVLNGAGLVKFICIRLCVV